MIQLYLVRGRVRLRLRVSVRVRLRLRLRLRVRVRVRVRVDEVVVRAHGERTGREAQRGEEDGHGQRQRPRPVRHLWLVDLGARQ
eukprot:scaffold24692_cov60-Phaeocystis_antarctica.AAC.1